MFKDRTIFHMDVASKLYRDGMEARVKGLPNESGKGSSFWQGWTFMDKHYADHCHRLTPRVVSKHSR